jgi:hypothetical protein
MSDTQHSRQRVIRASEIGQYKYCARAWWLGGVMDVPSSNTREMAQGETAHQQHGRAVWWSSALRVAAIVLALLAIVMLLLFVM